MSPVQFKENKAAALGPATVPWWLDWRGECVAIIASGPSASKKEVEKLRDRIHVIAIKESVNLCPWADVVYGCDGPWWKHRRGLREFNGLKLCYDKNVCTQFGLQHLNVEATIDKIMTDKPGLVGSGGNSGFQAINLAVQFGATGILLIGFDMNRADREPHWYGRNNWASASNPMPSNYDRWRTSLYAVAPFLRDSGIDVVNASRTSSADCFRKLSVDDALKGWGL